MSQKKNFPASPTTSVRSNSPAPDPDSTPAPASAPAPSPTPHGLRTIKSKLSISRRC